MSLLSKGLVSDQGAELDALDQRRDSHRVVALSRQQHESDEVAQGIGEGQDFGRHAALGFAARPVPAASISDRGGRREAETGNDGGYHENL
jgi:hypothetical protein